jgi:hypothetical protein
MRCILVIYDHTRCVDQSKCRNVCSPDNPNSPTCRIGRCKNDAAEESSFCEKHLDHTGMRMVIFNKPARYSK